MKIGILTSGGDSQGMNAAVRSAVRTTLYLGHTPYLIIDGYRGLYEGKINEAKANSVSNIIKNGGTAIGSSRLPEFKDDLSIREKCANNLKEKGIDALMVIGGNGSYMGASKLSELGINVVGVPGTIDNDINSTDYTIGFDTAVNIVVEAVDRLRDTITSHGRCSIVEVMGRDCGDIAIHAGIASGAELVVCAEHMMTEDEIVKEVIAHKSGRQKAHVIIVVAEKIFDTIELAKVVEEKTGISTRATILGHIQRGGTPTARDRVIASQLAAAGIEFLHEGKTGAAFGILNGVVTATPILEAVKMKKSDQTKNLIKLIDYLK